MWAAARPIAAAPAAAAAAAAAAATTRRRRQAGVVRAAAAGQQPPDAAVGRRTALAAGAALAAAAVAAAQGQVAHAAAAAADSPPPPLPLVPKAQLSPALALSRVEKGCWQLSGGHRGDRDSDRTAGDAAVDDFDAFFDAGVTSFDTADHYGASELLIGRWLRDKHPERRGEVQVCTKVCLFSGREMATLSRASVEAAVNERRERLGVDVIDLVQLYWGDYAYDKYVDAALYLTDLQAKGVLRAVGATNFDTPRLETMLDAGAQVVAHQVQYSLLDERPANGMAALCAARGVGLLCYGSVAGGFLSDRYLGVDARDVQVNTYSMGKYSGIIGQAGGWAYLQALLKALRRVADKHGTSVANVASRWVLQQPAVATVIVGARNARHVGDHRALFTFELDADDDAAIAAVLAEGKRAKGDCYDLERGGRW